MKTQAEKVAYWTHGYNFWEASQGVPHPAEYGEPQSFEDAPCAGLYRKGIYERDAKGNNRRVGWEPVAIFPDCGIMIARIGTESLGPDVPAVSVWTYVCGNSISESAYDDVAKHGKPWPDNPLPPEIPAANREVAKDDNAAPEVLTDKDHDAGIDNAIAAAVKVIKTEEDAAQALGSKNRIAELRLAADKAGKAEYEPLYATYVKSRDTWQAPVKRATAKEKELNTDILTFREQERQRLAREQAEAGAKQREIDEANERAAQRSIAAGEPEQPPEVFENIAPAAPAPIQPTYGTRKIKEELHTILDAITDYDAVYTFLKAEPKVKALLLELATAKVRAGFTVPGTTTRQGLI